MLVLARCKDESITIGDDVEITILSVKCGKVRLGITAPRSIPVHRKEIKLKIDKEKKNGIESHNTNSTPKADTAAAR